MIELIDYKGYLILDPEPTGPGGVALNTNWRKTGDDVEAINTELDTKADADHDPQQGTEDADHHRLRRDHPHDLPPPHADGPQQADLPRSLDHRQRERVDETDHCDDHGEAEQELDHDRSDQNLWNSVIADSKGNMDAARRSYIARRAARLLSQEKDRQWAAAARQNSTH